jgi:hypothetical protein
MSRLVPSRRPATAVLATLVTFALGLAASVPFTAVRPMTAVYTAMLVTGIGMFLRERVFPGTVTRSQPAVVQSAQINVFAKLSDSGAHL